MERYGKVWKGINRIYILSIFCTKKLLLIKLYIMEASLK
jgi:hypothetical protein